MSYGGSGNGAGAGGGYGQSGYGSYAQGNPYANSYQPTPSAPPRAYSPAGQTSSRPAQPQQQNPFASAQDMEMGQVTPAGANYNAPPTTAAQNNPHFVLNECRQISEGTDGISRLISQLESAHRRALASTSTDRTNPVIREIDSINADIMAQYKGLINRLKFLKKRPDAGSPGNQSQIGRVDRQLRETHQKYMVTENDFQKKMKEQTARQYRITNPEATEEEARRVAEEGNTQIFQQALMRSDRRGESRAILGNVRDRHEAIQKIERQMEELATLFQDMDRMVIEQEPMVQQVDQRVEETRTHVEEANTHLDGAIKSARAARRKKWICFGLSVAIIVVIIIVILIVLSVTHVI